MTRTTVCQTMCHWVSVHVCEPGPDVVVHCSSKKNWLDITGSALLLCLCMSCACFKASTLSTNVI